MVSQPLVRHHMHCNVAGLLSACCFHGGGWEPYHDGDEARGNFAHEETDQESLTWSVLQTSLSGLADDILAKMKEKGLATLEVGPGSLLYMPPTLVSWEKVPLAAHGIRFAFHFHLGGDMLGRLGLVRELNGPTTRRVLLPPVFSRCTPRRVEVIDLRCATVGTAPAARRRQEFCFEAGARQTRSNCSRLYIHT